MEIERGKQCNEPSPKTHRLDIVVSPEVKRQLEQQAAQAGLSARKYAALLLSEKVQTFAKAANTSLRRTVQAEALIGIQQAILRKKST
jgi:hypothetical protein